MSARMTLLLIEKLFALAAILQTLEWMSLRPAWSESGVFRWSLLRDDFRTFPAFLRGFFDAVLSERGFAHLLRLRLACAILLVLTPGMGPFVALLLFVVSTSTLLISMRWRGSFNGGSDSMTFHVSLALFFAAVFAKSQTVALGSLGYIAFHLTLSFFVSGVAKLASPAWRSGHALRQLVTTSNYGPPAIFARLLSQPALSFLLGWLIIVFECAFPFAFFMEGSVMMIIVTALFFHILNYCLFGLNRFFFAWLAAYPVLFFFNR